MLTLHNRVLIQYDLRQICLNPFQKRVRYFRPLHSLSDRDSSVFLNAMPREMALSPRGCGML